MKRLLHAKPDKTGWGAQHNHDISTKKRWTLPGIKCSECKSTWSSTGLSYPWIDLADIPEEPKYRSGSPVDNEEFKRRCAPIRRMVGSTLPLRPGTSLGPRTGHACGELGDFAWPFPWEMLVSETALAKLIDAGIRLPHCVRTDLRFGEKLHVPYYEVATDAFVEISMRTFTPDTVMLCSVCGRLSGQLDRLVLLDRPAPGHTDTVRPSNFETYVLVTEKFAEIIEKLELTNIVLEDVVVRDD